MIHIKVHTPERPILLADEARYAGGLFYTDLGNNLVLIPTGAEPGGGGFIRAVSMEDGRGVLLHSTVRLTPAVGVSVTITSEVP